MDNEGMYYVIPYDRNRIRLVDDKYEINLPEFPTFIDMVSSGSGTLSMINPLVTHKEKSKN